MKREGLATVVTTADFGPHIAAEAMSAFHLFGN
jgi:hypothetical protein